MERRARLAVLGRARAAPLVVAAGVALAAAGLAGAASPAAARVLVTREAALAQAFGERARLTTATVFLTPSQVKQVEHAAAARLASPRVVRYRATRGDTLLGTAYLDTHPVRTLSETILIVVTPAGRAGAVEVLAFHEPEDYLPPARWLSHFADQPLSPGLRPGRDVPALGGATLTARAVAAAVRRTLALHAAIEAGERK